jgi:hypothetical protein
MTGDYITRACDFLCYTRRLAVTKPLRFPAENKMHGSAYHTSPSAQNNL